MRLEEMAARTPAARDRYVDFLRAASIATVVLGHWTIAMIWREDERVWVTSAIGVTSGLWLATWVLQVMPVFFFVGGFSNAVSWDSARRRGDGFRAYMRARTARLLRPAAVFGGIWVAVQAALHLAGAGGDRVVRLSLLPFGPLWFLLVYVGVVAATPAMLAVHRRVGFALPLALAVAVAGIDVLRFGGGVARIGWVNLAVVWFLAHQAGFFYADGSLVRAGRRAHLALAAAGLGGLVALTNIGVYPRSMIGTDVEELSNMNPPTLCIVALTLWQVGLAMLARERVARWLAGPRAWKAVIAANAFAMTAFLWHLTAYLVAILALWPLGLGRPHDTTTEWWVQRPLWLAVPAVLLGVFLLVFGRFERPRTREPA